LQYVLDVFFVFSLFIILFTTMHTPRISTYKNSLRIKTGKTLQRTGYVPVEIFKTSEAVFELPERLRGGGLNLPQLFSRPMMLTRRRQYVFMLSPAAKTSCSRSDVYAGSPSLITYLLTWQCSRFHAVPGHWMTLAHRVSVAVTIE